MAQSEEDLVRRAAAGDRDAFAALYRLHVGAVVGYLGRRVPRDQVDDLAADTFAAAYRHIGGFEWRGVPLRAWLLRIASRQLVSRARRRSSTELTVADPDAVPDAGFVDALVDRMANAAALRGALAALSGHQRAVIELRYFSELDVPGTAAVLGLGHDAVRALTHRAMVSLRQHLATAAG